MKWQLIRAPMATVLIALAGCTTQPEDIRLAGPALDPKAFFSGQMTANGIVQDYKGRQLRSFTADIVGQWQGDIGLLDEHFVFDDGEEQHRCWKLKVDGQKLTGTAGDVVGMAEGKFSGNALIWAYTLELPEHQGGWSVNLDDRLFLLNPKKLLNRTRMSKLGLPVGEITLVIDKVSEQAQRENSADCSL
ncbi:DUF3833 domain-containing protein [Pseudoteredinibacter isoporae]|uniref:DUF3833 domain-containing protein n=1 Tax=Pseudoteredinibacter isoporae TaxID=570281 RepID=A0A7X0JVI1_9GAMM|nr:DUF3833 domain-containing protein [Pseudoteredinibacter isoporae]MBB6523033.1 hypothetical protein [Pseudoteredinibacter isoporae]NHO88555.1 DUF3833 domain-containing protein [Pseudoteredinibacter isoporae]NIB22754.1 DUF3833 domain-containing protein [Pseudoteredinibacter isoporae]